MKEYLSFGAGVNSTALMLLLLDEGRDFEPVFIDTGCEWPETYSFLNLLIKEGYEFTWIKPEVEGENNLYDYCLKWKTVPSTWQRFCTDKFKVRPMHNYIKKPCILYIGYDFGERNRRFLRDKKDIIHKKPLIKRLIGRERCKKIILEHDLPVPPRSGCWFCPFQTIHGWKKLRNKHPDLFQKALELENANPRGWTFIQNLRLSALWQEEKLTDFQGFETYPGPGPGVFAEITNKEVRK